MRAGDEAQCNPQDLFRLFMLFAISGVTRYRSGLSKEHPFGYYLAALAHIGSVQLIGTPDAIQNSLLIGRFGMYHHVGTSLWDISHFWNHENQFHNKTLEINIYNRNEGNHIDKILTAKH